MVFCQGYSLGAPVQPLGMPDFLRVPSKKKESGKRLSN
jgi:hypothetical protein